MSLMRSLTTRRKPEVEPLKPIQIGRAASQRGGRPVLRSQISPPLKLVSTTNVLSFEAPDIAGTKPIESATTSPASATSATSGSSDDSDCSGLSIHSRETDPTDLSSADASPISADTPNHLSQYFKQANYEASLRNRSLSTTRTNPVPVLSLSVASHTAPSNTLTPQAARPTPATALTPNAAMLTPAPATALSPGAAMLTPCTALSPSTAALFTSGLVDGLSPINAVRTPVSAIRSPGDQSAQSSSPDSPALPRRAPSHSKRAHEALSRKRSIQRARSPSRQGRNISRTRTSADMFSSSGLSPAVLMDSPDSIFSPNLAQVQEESVRAKYADAALDAHYLETKGLASLDAQDYLLEIDPLVSVLLDDNAPTGPDFSGWF